MATGPLMPMFSQLYLQQLAHGTALLSVSVGRAKLIAAHHGESCLAILCGGDQFGNGEPCGSREQNIEHNCIYIQVTNYLRMI